MHFKMAQFSTEGRLLFSHDPILLQLHFIKADLNVAVMWDANYTIDALHLKRTEGFPT